MDLAHAAARTVLIALNATPRLHRAAICRLGSEPGSWWPEHEPTAAVAARLGVAEHHLRSARRVAARAPAIAESEGRRARELGARILTLLDDDYPTRLRELPLPPPVLYLRGTLPSGPAVAMVGSRMASDYGLEAAGFFARELAAAGVLIVSGFARGIDGAAHEGALSAPGGTTLAVLGCGLGVDYPKAHRSLRGRMAHRGGLITELPCGTPPRPWHFPVRNRIIAALAGVVFVLEAATRSGSLITARHALELGRDIFALPGRIFEERALGPNALIRDGAAPALHPQDLLDALPEVGKTAATRIPEMAPLPGLPGQLLEQLAPGSSLSLDQLVAATGAPSERILVALLELELAGRIRRRPGPTWGCQL